jgi:hypothetical protein
LRIETERLEEVTAIKPQIGATALRPRGHGIPPALIFCGLFICMGCGWLGLQVAGPIQVANKLHSENDVLERSLRRAQIRNQEAEKEVQAIGTEEGAKVAARAHGFMFAREHPLHMQNEPTPQPSPAKTP